MQGLLESIHVNDLPIASEVGVLDDKIAATCLAVAPFHGTHSCQAHVVADLLQRRQNHLVGVLPAAGVLLEGRTRVLTEPRTSVSCVRWAISISDGIRQPRPCAIWSLVREMGHFHLRWHPTAEALCDLEPCLVRLVLCSTHRLMQDLQCDAALCR